MNQAPPGALGHVVRQKLGEKKKKKRKSGLGQILNPFRFDERDPGVKREARKNGSQCRSKAAVIAVRPAPLGRFTVSS